VWDSPPRACAGKEIVRKLSKGLRLSAADPSPGARGDGHVANRESRVVFSTRPTVQHRHVESRNHGLAFASVQQVAIRISEGGTVTMMAQCLWIRPRMQEVLGSSPRLGGLSVSQLQASRGISTLESRASGLQSSTQGDSNWTKMSPPSQTNKNDGAIGSWNAAGEPGM